VGTGRSSLDGCGALVHPAAARAQGATGRPCVVRLPKKGAGIRCQGKTRLTMRSPGHAPMGLRFLPRNERVAYDGSGAVCRADRFRVASPRDSCFDLSRSRSLRYTELQNKA
jgi:hypothetical protein